MNRPKAIHHVSMIIADSLAAREFYQGVLGLEVVNRPELGFPGLWLSIGEQQIHLLELPNPDSATGRPEHGGRDRHLAMTVDDLDSLAERLEECGISCTRSKSGRKALFCRDPDGNGLEFIEDTGA
ncbi:VOC family protein [Thiolapillus brandeum]|nr:VOC family protein [Thiolapillus brandeum]